MHGVGLRGLQSATIDCGNAGTLARLIVGLLAFQDGTFTLTGDESLSARPMERIAEPLRQMGAQIETTDGHLPLTITGTKLAGDRLRAARRERAGQVGHPARRPRRAKADDRDRAGADARPHRADAARRGRARDDRPNPSASTARQHAARLGRRAGRLLVGGAVHRRRDARARGRGSRSTTSTSTRAVPGCSTCSTGWARGSGSSTRRRVGSEQAATSRCAAELTATTINTDEVPLLVDELPLFGCSPRTRAARAGSTAPGAPAQGDRSIEALVDALRASASARRPTDGFAVTGVPTRPRGGQVDARGDHRIAMLGAVAGLASREGVEIEGAESVGVSFPGFPTSWNT